MKVIKNSGEVVAFNPDKLRHSLLKSGASEADATDIIGAIRSRLYDGIPTKHIYKMAGKMLRKLSASHAARYNLKAGIRQLGPAGFFFEQFVALVFEAEGYQTRKNLTLCGRCVNHEVDVVIRAEDLTMVECKFHGNQNTVSDVKVPMYILSRFNDLKNNTHDIFTSTDSLSKCLIVTNNRFTADAIKFASCSGLQLLGWDYPATDGLKNKVDGKKLYPVTCLTTLTMLEKEKLLILGVILVAQLIDQPETLAQAAIGEARHKKILHEAAGLCNLFQT